MFNHISEIKRANRENGFHFFEKDTLRFFNSRIGGKVFGGRYFVTSERCPSVNQDRRYTIRMIRENGSIHTVDGFQAFATARAAQNRITEILKGDDNE